MSTTKYLLVSLPTSISSSNDKEEAFEALSSTVTTSDTSVQPFKIPDFKIGTLDALVQQADELAKLENSCQGVVGKVGDSLKSLLEGDEEKIAQQKTVNDSMLEHVRSARCTPSTILTVWHRTCGPILTNICLEQGQV